MGTRADFYIGIDKNAEWLGSIAWDGHLDPDKEVLKAQTETEFREALEEFFVGRDDVSLPKDGWPWPWNNSEITDCVYAFHNGKVYTNGPNGWVTIEQTCLLKEGEDWDDLPAGISFDFPDMSGLKNVQLRGPKSGLIVIER